MSARRISKAGVSPEGSPWRLPGVVERVQHASLQPEAGQDRADVGFHGALDEVQPSRDLRVGQSLADQPQHVALPLGEDRELFAGGEAIFRAHGGRPHWAKRHTLAREEVDALYPMAERYREVRRAADPDGKFLNPHLEALFS